MKGTAVRKKPNELHRRIPFSLLELPAIAMIRLISPARPKAAADIMKISKAITPEKSNEISLTNLPENLDLEILYDLLQSLACLIRNWHQRQP